MFICYALFANGHQKLKFLDEQIHLTETRPTGKCVHDPTLLLIIIFQIYQQFI